MGFRALRLLAAVLLAATLATTGAACTSHKEKRDPVLAGDLVAGGSYDPATYKGKVTVVNFWGSWCAPCRAEADDLEKTYQATKDKGVTFVGVNTRDERDAAKAFERGRVTYPSIYDVDAKVALQFDVTQVSTPATLIIDRQGRIAVALRQATTVTQLQPLVEKVAAEETR